MVEISWVMPLLLIPGVALLINAVSTRYGQFQMEVHHMLDESKSFSYLLTPHLRRRAVMFRNTLVSFHVSVGVFALGSVIGAVFDVLRSVPEIPVSIFTMIGICSLIYGIVELIREASLSQEVILQHLLQIESEQKS